MDVNSQVTDPMVVSSNTQGESPGQTSALEAQAPPATATPSTSDADVVATLTETPAQSTTAPLAGSSSAEVSLSKNQQKNLFRTFI